MLKISTLQQTTRSKDTSEPRYRHLGRIILRRGFPPKKMPAIYSESQPRNSHYALVANNLILPYGFLLRDHRNSNETSPFLRQNSKTKLCKWTHCHDDRKTWRAFSIEIFECPPFTTYKQLRISALDYAPTRSQSIRTPTEHA